MDPNIDRSLERGFKSIIEEPDFIALYLPIFLANVLIAFISMEHLVPEISASYQPSSLEAFRTSVEDYIMDHIWEMALAGLAYAASWIALGITAIAGTVLKADAMERGEHMGALEAFERGLGYVPRLFVASTLVALIAWVPLILLIALGVMVNLVLLIVAIIWIIPAIYLSVRLLLFIPSGVLDDKGPLGCLKGSWNVTKRNFWPVFVILLFLTVVSGVGSSVSNSFLSGWANVLFGSAISVIFGPIYNVALTVLYLVLKESKPQRGL